MIAAAYGTDLLPAGLQDVFVITAGVPAEAPYGATQIVAFDTLQLNEGNIEAQGDSAVHAVTYLGDSTGNRDYSGLDAAWLARVTVGFDTGFDAYPTVDPVIVADVSGNGEISAYDAVFVAQEVVGQNVPEIPDRRQAWILAAA